jgi:hypothetical protein
MTVSYFDQQNILQKLNVDVLAKNERVVLCRVSRNSGSCCYMQYHTIAGWRDLDRGDTLLSRQMPGIIANPFDIHS